MLQNASLLAIVAVHTAENEPSKVGESLEDLALEVHHADLEAAAGVHPDLRPVGSNLDVKLQTARSRLYRQLR